MINSNQNGLEIFENFSIDYNLPKHTRDDTVPELSNNMTPTTGGWGSFVDSDSSNSGTSGNGRFKFKWLQRFRKTIVDKNAAKVENRKQSAVEFFKQIQGSFTSVSFDEHKFEERTRGYLKSIEHAKLNGQTALVETLQNQQNVVGLESSLYASIYNPKVITEEQVVKFVKNSEKGLRLDWVKNFTRVIPSDITNRKVEFDKLKVFDNYVVMHYDPDGKSWKETHEEIEKRKDPILFGLIKDSNKLYVIGDWKDEFCELTVEDFIAEFGEDAINKNNITVNV